MGLLGNLFKSKRRRQIEREAAIERVLSLHRRRIKALEGHERGYAEKAVRARREGDKGNFRRLLKLTADTMNERRRLQSAQLSFEALVQTKERIQGYSAFADGMQNATRAIEDVFQDVDLESITLKVNEAAVQAQSLDSAMNRVLDGMSLTLFGTPAEEDDLVSVADVESMLTEEAVGREATADDEIQSLLGRVEQKLKETS